MTRDQVLIAGAMASSCERDHQLTPPVLSLAAGRKSRDQYADLATNLQEPRRRESIHGHLPRRRRSLLCVCQTTPHFSTKGWPQKSGETTVSGSPAANAVRLGGRN